MWLVEDEAMRKLLDGEFCEVVEMKKDYKLISVKDLFKFQFKYDTPQGFGKFYNSHLKDIIDKIDYIDDTSIVGKFLNRFIRK